MLLLSGFCWTPGNHTWELNGSFTLMFQIVFTGLVLPTEVHGHRGLLFFQQLTFQSVLAGLTGYLDV